MLCGLNKLPFFRALYAAIDLASTNNNTHKPLTNGNINEIITGEHFANAACYQSLDRVATRSRRGSADGIWSRHPSRSRDTYTSPLNKMAMENHLTLQGVESKPIGRKGWDIATISNLIQKRAGITLFACSDPRGSYCNYKFWISNGHHARG